MRCNVRNLIRSTAALAAFGSPLLAQDDYQAACRATPEKFDMEEPTTEEDVAKCVCGYEVMAQEMGEDRVGYVVTWMLSDKPFEEITAEVSWGELAQAMAELGPEVEARCAGG